MLTRADRKQRREITRLTRDLYRRGALSKQKNAIEGLRDLGEITVIRDWLASGQLAPHKDALHLTVARLLAEIDDPTVDEVLAMLSPTIEYSAATLLLKSGSGWTIVPLRQWAVANRHSPLALEMIEGIGRIGGRRASTALVALLATPPLNVGDRARWELTILQMLGDAGHDGAVETLRAWTSPDHSVMARTIAVDSIGRIGGPAAAEALQAMKNDQSLHNAVRSVAGRRIERDRAIALRARGWLSGD